MKISNVGIFVKDLEGAKNFFINYFGAEVHAVYNEEENRYYSYIMKMGEGAKLELMTAEECDALDAKCDQKIKEAKEFALAGEYPDASEYMKYVYVD